MMTLIVGPGGRARAIYSEEIGLDSLGPCVVTRASHVEPGADGLWHVDLSPVSGPALSGFSRRSEAVAAEVAWLERHWLTPRR